MTTPAKLTVETFVSELFEENAYLVYRRAGGPCWIVDPSFHPQPQHILESVRRASLAIEAVILTHGHADHIAGVDVIRAAAPGARLLIARDARSALADPDENLSAAFGMPLTVSATPNGDLVPNQLIELDGLAWKVLDTSGHSPGGRSLYCPDADVVLVGDALFAGSVGRCDFHHSDPALLASNIRDQLFNLPDSTVVYSGHGPATTIGHERLSNPYVGQGT